MHTTDNNFQYLNSLISTWATDLGFSAVGISDVDLKIQEQPFLEWLDAGFHGTMKYMEQHGLKRTRPDELEHWATRVISVRLNYLPTDAKFAKILNNPQLAYISRYALGRDYHKLMRKRLQKLADKINLYLLSNQSSNRSFKFRALVDSAPVLERPLAEKAKLGATGKHSLLINKEAGSWFFIGELFTNVPLPLVTQSTTKEDLCGKCTACISICPTNAIVKPYVVDARRCISYLTIESSEPIPIEFRKAIGNRIYGCDDCQLVCPWNQHANLSNETDFQTRHHLDEISLLELFAWNESDFLEKFQGSAIRRIGYQNWIRNIAVALGNSDYSIDTIEALRFKLNIANVLVTEHIHWALEQQYLKQKESIINDHDKLLTKRLVNAIEKLMPRDAK